MTEVRRLRKYDPTHDLIRRWSGGIGWAEAIALAENCGMPPSRRTSSWRRNCRRFQATGINYRRSFSIWFTTHSKR